MENKKLEMDVLSVDEAAAYLKFSRAYLYRLRRRKRFRISIMAGTFFFGELICSIGLAQWCVKFRKTGGRA